MGLENWPARQIVMVSRADLKAYDRNSRTHSEEQVAQLARSIREWGWTIPVLIDPDRNVIAGHGRLLAAAVLEIAEVPCMIAEGWTEAQRRAYVLADNRLAENAGWDDVLLAEEIGFLTDADFDLGLTGFSDKDLAASLNPPTGGLTDPDDLPDAPDVPVSMLGDVWVLGRHRIICGDATDAKDVDAVLAGVKPHLMVTDPPYGVEYDANWRNRVKRADGSIVSGLALGKVANDDRADWSEAWDLFPGDVAYVWHSGRHAHTVAESLKVAGFNLRAQIIWAKSSLLIGRGDYHWQHEPCWYAVRKGRTGHFDGGRKQTTLWQIEKPRKSETGHSTQKPIECMKRPIENNSSPGQAVYEPFSGSGTTIIAAEMTGRACYAIELNPAYVDVAVKRWQDFTGQAATLEGDGRTFAEIGKERGIE
jgi:DNA modification methylase